MAKLHVTAGQSLLESYVKTPAVGLCELVWNAFDEDARTVAIACEYNDAGGLEEITVTDDGLGTTSAPSLHFPASATVGSSWKGL